MNSLNSLHASLLVFSLQEFRKVHADKGSLDNLESIMGQYIKLVKTDPIVFVKQIGKMVNEFYRTH